MIGIVIDFLGIARLLFDGFERGNGGSNGCL